VSVCSSDPAVSAFARRLKAACAPWKSAERPGRLAAVSSFKSVNGFPSACADVVRRDLPGPFDHEPRIARRRKPQRRLPSSDVSTGALIIAGRCHQATAGHVP
jgi:hypothetical protein